MAKVAKLQFASVRERITGGIAPNEQGAKDGLANFPDGGATAASPYQLDCQHRAWEIAGELEKSSGEAVKQEIETLRLNPFAIPGAGAAERCNAVMTDALGAMDARLHHDHHKLLEASEHRSAKHRDREHDFHLADAKSPPRGWANRWKSLNTLAIVGAGEVGISYLVLQHALGPTKALIWGGIGPTVTMMLGGLAGYFNLRPANRSHRRSIGAYLRHTGAALAGGVALVVMYGISAYRSVLIDGMDGIGAEIWQRAMHEAYKMAQPETLVLAILGALGFLVSYRKMQDYFGGFTQRIREVDLAKIEAHDALVEERDATIAYVTEPAQQAMANLGGQLNAVRAWCTTVADTCDRILSHVLDHNDSLRVINNALDSVDQDYRRSNTIVRTAPSPAWAPLPAVGHEVTVPETVVEARIRSADIARAWAAATDGAFAELNRAIRDAIAFIDEVAGLGSVSTLPARPVALFWRKAS